MFSVLFLNIYYIIRVWEKLFESELSGYDWSVLYIDDGSQDDTLEHIVMLTVALILVARKMRTRNSSRDTPINITTVLINNKRK